MPTGSKRTLRSLSWRPLAIGLILVVLLAGGMLAEAAVSRAGGTTTSTSVGSASTSTTSTGPAKASGSHGSTGLYVGVVVLFVLFIGALYGTDLVWENRRQDKVLEYVKAHRDDLTQDQRAQLLDKLTDGTDGLVRALIALGAIGVFAAALFYFLIRNPDISNKTIVENAMTALVTLLTAITAFYFGTRAAQKTGDGGQDATKKT
jgi:hypothetical protein